MFPAYDTSDPSLLKPLVTGWLAKIEAGLTCAPRKRWKEISDECLMFYSRSAAAMWDQNYSRKFWRGVKAPRFRITINKAFELVAVFSPNLLWDIPFRQVEAKKQFELPEILFQNQPQVWQAIQQEKAIDHATDQMIAALMGAWLNYTPREMPGGGLEAHNELAVVDALVKGRGCLWPARFTFPGSGRTTTGCFHDSPDNLIIDPDFKKLDQAKWIARRHVMPYWEVERRFELPVGSLKSKAKLESAWHWAELQGTPDKGTADRNAGKTNDLIVWYEVWSKMGSGARLTGMADSIKYPLEQVVGDYAYLALCPDCPYPLNCPTSVLQSGATEDEVRSRFSWPVPLWTDDRWPVEVLDFYTDPEGSWPIAPLAPGLGELKFLNFLIPWACNRIYSSSRDFWAVAGQNLDDFKKYLEQGEDQTVLPVPPGIDDIKKALAVIQQPETRFDIWKIIELVSQLFDMRVGLTPTVYGQNEGGTQDRTAEITKSRQRAVGVRPDYMRKKVVAWQSRAATVEGFLTRWFVTAQDVAPLLGSTGAALWQQYIESTDVERVVRQMQYTIAASSIRRPDRDRDIDNMQEVMARWLPVAQQYGVQTGDYTPINGMMKKWADSHDMGMEECYFPPPQQDENAQAMQQAHAQAELENVQADTDSKRATAEQRRAQAQAQGPEDNTVEEFKQLLEMEHSSQKHSADMRMQAAKFGQQQNLERAKATQDLALNRQKTNAQIQATKTRASQPRKAAA